MRRPALAFLLAVPLLAQNQTSFYAAWEDAQEAEHLRNWRAALGACERAVALRPAPGAAVITYGNNVLRNYYPYTFIARCHLELGEPQAAEAWLRRPEALKEPREMREALERRLRERNAVEPGRNEAQPILPTPAAQSPEQAAPILALPAPESKPLLLPPPSLFTQGAIQEGAPLPKPPGPPVAAPPRPAVKIPARVAQGPEPIPGTGLLWVTLLAMMGGGFFLWWLWTRREAKRRPQEAATFTGRIPDRVGPYRILRLLGRGGSATTYLARHEGTGGEVALKVLDSHRAEDAEYLRRFQREAELGSLLDHPSIVRILATGTSNKEPWIAMEFVPGENLEKHLHTQGPLPLAMALDLARPIASAMAYAHSRGVVHRDLKPGNILLHQGRVRIADFGIARILGSDTLTETAAYLGTPLYSAPETQVKAQVGPAADRYAFGVLLYEMLAGHPPFRGETPFEVLDKHRRDPFPDLAAIRPDLPESLIRLIHRLSAKDPEERPEDGELVRVLDELDSGASRGDQECAGLGIKQ